MRIHYAIFYDGAGNEKDKFPLVSVKVKKRASYICVTVERIKLKCLQHQEMIKRTRQREKEEKQKKNTFVSFSFSFVCIVRVKSGVNECDMNRSTTLHTA